ncbi:hypothetical protein FK268_18035 [Tsukamurella sputi]|uniref:Uncharacterized protein n=1 Tax=Tsukamurella sputi TaxID=2591848 RepID=A0A5C5RKA8_9ACTN|nr:hypothetical protein [Tsukamurella sputi]TWS22903.1 hypothetical protein FK268_18035 [Tsukamurella sputi]
MTSHNSSLTALTRRLVVAAVATAAIAASVVTAPAGATPTTHGCPAQGAPTLTLGKPDGVRVEVPAVPGWRHAASEPEGSGIRLGRIESSDDTDSFYATFGVIKEPQRYGTSEKFAALITRGVASRHASSGPCGLPSMTVATHYVEATTKRPVADIKKLTVFELGGQTVALTVTVATYDESRLPQLERDLLNRYGITL